MLNPRRGTATVVASALTVVVFYCALQYWWLPPDGFLTGDQGAKFLQARAVLAHGPFSPWVEGPSLDVDTQLRWQEPFLMPHAGRLVGVFPWLFAAVTAPFLGLLGLRGLYVVPALSVAILFVAACGIGRRLGQSASGVWSGWCAVLATPLLVYGAELWEHAPAVALTTIAAALMMPGPSRRGWMVVAGACLIAAATMRAETLLMMPALVAGRAWALTSGGVARGAAGGTTVEWRELARDLAALGLGSVVTAVLVAAGNVAVYSTIVPHQLSSNLAVDLPYLGVRSQAMLALVLPVWHRKVFVVALLLVAAGAAWRSDRTRVGLTHAGVLLMLVVGLGVPLWRTHAGDLAWLSTFGPQNIAHTWPFVFVLPYWVALRRSDPGERYLFAAAGVYLFLVFAAMPHTGGAQWGARFFLAAAPLAAILAVQMVARPRDAGGRARAGWGVRAVAAVAIAASVAVQISGLFYLRGFKRVNAYITHATARLAPPGDVVVSDLFWFPEITATLYPTRRLLFAWSPADFPPIAAQAAAVGVRGLWVATSTPLTGYAPPAEFAGVEGGPSWRLADTHELHASSLTLYEYRRNW